MSTSPRPTDPADAKPMTEEADIGSGDKSPGQLETEKIIKSIPPLPDDDAGKDGSAS